MYEIPDWHELIWDKGDFSRIPEKTLQAFREQAAYRRPVQLGMSFYVCGADTPGAFLPCRIPLDRRMTCPMHGVVEDGLLPSPRGGQKAPAPYEAVLQELGSAPDAAAFDQAAAEQLWLHRVRQDINDGQYLERLTRRHLDYESMREREKMYEIVQGAGGSGDGGIDVVAETHTGRTLAFQCKHYAEPVTAATMKVFHYDTTLGWENTAVWRKHHQQRARHRVFITTSEFTAPAREVAEASGIHLLEGTRLTVWFGYGLPLHQVLRIPADRW
ncbi:restriction endonuclease [Streptomyces hydrogenans]|uniref:restriction endonuclease n=1 Tax=Streptomyces hydrogenans TaxID=1873719 RepID=UPI00382774E6